MSSVSDSLAGHRGCVLHSSDAADGLDVDWGKTVQVIQTDDVELGVNNLKYDCLINTRTITLFCLTSFSAGVRSFKLNCCRELGLEY